MWLEGQTVSVPARSVAAYVKREQELTELARKILRSQRLQPFLGPDLDHLAEEIDLAVTIRKEAREAGLAHLQMHALEVEMEARKFRISLAVGVGLIEPRAEDSTHSTPKRNRRRNVIQ
jgi:hypothetical protein